MASAQGNLAHNLHTIMSGVERALVDDDTADKMVTLAINAALAAEVPPAAVAYELHVATDGIVGSFTLTTMRDGRPHRETIYAQRPEPATPATLQPTAPARSSSPRPASANHSLPPGVPGVPPARHRVDGQGHAYTQGHNISGSEPVPMTGIHGQPVTSRTAPPSPGGFNGPATTFTGDTVTAKEGGPLYNPPPFGPPSAPFRGPMGS